MTRSSKLFLGSFLLVLAALAIFAQYMQWRKENTLFVCLTESWSSCGDVVAVPGERILLDDVVGLPHSARTENYWAKINGRPVAVDIEEDGHGGVNLYAVVPQPEPHLYARPSPLDRAEQHLQECINAGGQLYVRMDENWEGEWPEITGGRRDKDNYPCVLTGGLSSPYALVFSAEEIPESCNGALYNPY